MNSKKKREILLKAQMQYEGQRKKQKTSQGKEKSIPIQKQPIQQDVDIENEDDDGDEDFEDVDDNELNEMPDTDMEDEFDDEYEEEEGGWEDQQNDEQDDDDDEQIEEEKNQQNQQQNQQKQIQEPPKSTLRRRKEHQPKPQPDKRVWFNDGLKDELLDFDNKAYNMLHRVNTEWPCLSCDIILTEEEQLMYKNKQFQKMDKYPYTVYMAAGTQASSASKNQLYLMKLSKLHKTKYDDDSDRDDSEDEDILNDEEGEVQLDSVVGLKHGVNRIRSMNHEPVVAYWSESGDVMIVNLQTLMDKYKADEEAEDDTKVRKSTQYNINQLQHRSFSNSNEGFALDWSPIQKGHLATGSLDGEIFTYAPKDQMVSDYLRDTKPYVYHRGQSVEDIQWSPVEAFAFASCSIDGTVQVCDTRVGNRGQSQILIKAHECDVNVISWNGVSTNLIASGADDGCFKVWDLRYPTKDSISEILWHTKPITSIQFQPNSDSTLAVSSADNKLSIWDFAVENDDQEVAGDDNVPDQLMFVHQGQKDLKELRYHPIYNEMIVSTAGSGFNIFKPTQDEAQSESSEEDEKGEIPKIHEKDLDDYLSKLSLQ